MQKYEKAKQQAFEDKMDKFAWSGLKQGINCTLNNIILFIIFILGAKFSID